MTLPPEVPYDHPAVGADPVTGVPVCMHGDDAAACQLLHREHATCIDVSAPGAPAYVCGPRCPGSLSADEVRRMRERDERIRIYRARERRRAARALDRYIEMMGDSERDGPAADAAAERFIEHVGDYVLSRLPHSGSYGVPALDRDLARRDLGPMDPAEYANAAELNAELGVTGYTMSSDRFPVGDASGERWPDRGGQ